MPLLDGDRRTGVTESASVGIEWTLCLGSGGVTEARNGPYADTAARVCECVYSWLG